jgi:hypothetical protein
VTTYCGRAFSPEELERIRALAAAAPHREALAAAVCAELGWRKPDGGLKTMSCKVALLRMQRDGLVMLPAPLHPRWASRNVHAPVSAWGLPVRGSRADIADLALEPVVSRAASQAWNAMMREHHYLGYQPLPGAQLRYLITDHGVLLGGLGFGAAVWKAAPRDDCIGWTAAERQAGLHLIVNNARFLLLPWVNVKNLASSVLALAARRLPQDWIARYHIRPVLLETFVEHGRFRGTCYRAANWIHVGQTKGRGKLDRYKRAALHVKDIFLYPLDPAFRQALRSARPAGTSD